MTLIKQGKITSLILILTGIIGYAIGKAGSITALIPTIFGLLILLSVFIAKKNLKVGIHLAAVFGLLGFLAPLGRLIPTIMKEGFQCTLPFFSQLIMVFVCGTFLKLCIATFKEVRQKRIATAKSID